MELGNYDEALTTVSKGLKLDGNNGDLKSLERQVEAITNGNSVTDD